MSCLSERERMALEDIFLSISTNQSPYERCKNIYRGYAPSLHSKAKQALAFIQSAKTLKSYRYSKLFFRQKQHKIRKQLGFRHHP